MAIEGASQYDSLRAAIPALLRAWRDELLALAEERMPALAASGRRVLEVEIGAHEFSLRDGAAGRLLGSVPRDEAASAGLARVVSREGEMGRDCVLHLAPALVLRPTLRMPQASRRVLKGVLVHELERLTPIDPAELYFDFVVEGKEPQSNAMQIALRIVQKSILDEALAVCHGAGLLVGSISFGGESQEADWQSFPVDRPAFIRAQWRRFGNLALAAFAVFLFFAVVVAGYERGLSANAALEDQVADTMTRAAIVERMEHRIEAANVQVARLAAQRRGPLVIETLAALARLFPNGTWLTELHIEGTKIRADGFSKNASDLIGILDHSGIFVNAQFSAPLVRNPGDGTDRFELTFDRLAQRSSP